MGKSNKKNSLYHSERKANAFPYLSTPMQERLKMSNNINLENNHTLEMDENGYWKISPIDDTRTL